MSRHELCLNLEIIEPSGTKHGTHILFIRIAFEMYIRLGFYRLLVKETILSTLQKSFAKKTSNLKMVI